MTLQSHYNMIIIKYKVKYLLYLKIFLLRNKKEAAYLICSLLGRQVK